MPLHKRSRRCLFNKCSSKFTTHDPRQLYCNPGCKNAAAQQRWRDRIKERSERFRKIGQAGIRKRAKKLKRKVKRFNVEPFRGLEIT